MTTTTLAYQAATRNLTTTLARKAAEPTVANDTAYYLKNITEVKSVDDFMGDYRLYNYALKAYGLGDMVYAKAFIRKVLEGGVDERDSFANRLTDPRYKEFATAFNFERYGSATTTFDRTQQGTVDRFVRQKLEEDLGAQNDGVRLALYFERKAPSITNAFELLADPALLQVTLTALGLPKETSNMSIDRQAELISKRIDFEDFKDPVELRRFLTRFTALNDLNNGSGSSSSGSVPSIFSGGNALSGVSADLLMQIQSLPIGGR